MKKAQMEIAGLLIIVVLITITLLVFLSFRVGGPNEKIPAEQNIRESYLRDRYSQVLLQTTTNCEKKTIRSLLADCAYQKAIDCYENNQLFNSCQYANKTIEKILNETLNLYGIEYAFSVIAVDDSRKLITYFKTQKCDLSKQNKIPYFQPAKTDFGDLLINLTQCK